MFNTPVNGRRPADHQSAPFSDQPDTPETKRAGRARIHEQAVRQRKTARLEAVVNRILLSRRRVPRLAAQMLGLEHAVNGATHDPDTASHGEILVGSIGKSAGDAVLTRTSRSLNRQAARNDARRAYQRSLRIRAEHRPASVVSHPVGGVATAAQTRADLDVQRAEIAREEQQGSRKHHRQPRLMRLLPTVVLAFDAALLSYFFAGVTNVDWSRPLSASLLFALMLAGAVTVIGYGCFALTGRMLNAYKNDDGTLDLHELDPATKLVIGLSGLAILVLATLMFVRMRAEVLLALGPDHTADAFVIAVTLAVVSVLANTMVVAVHALDGSESTARLDALGRVVRRPITRQHRFLERAACLEPRIAVAIRKGQRTAAISRTRAGRRVSVSERTIDAARVRHNGVGPTGQRVIDPNSVGGVVGYREPTTRPQVDERPLRLAVEHLSTPLRPEDDSA